MRFSWFDLAGNVGVVILIVTYLLLQLERLDARRVAYSALNALGAGLIALFAYYSAFNAVRVHHRDILGRDQPLRRLPLPASGQRIS